MREVKVVFNVLCNKKIRIVRLEALIEQLIEIEPKFISIRLRGIFAEEAQIILDRKFLDLNYVSFHIQIGEKYKCWKMNTLDQIIHDGPRTEYIAIFQEDFQFMVSPQIVNTYVQESIKDDVDAIELLAGPWYGMSSPDLEELLNNRALHVISLDLNRMNIVKMGRVVHQLTSWPAIYKETVMLKALISKRPYFKKFHPDFPFDWEKSVKAKWLLPLRWCAPRFEILACIDYDSLWSGSSLQSRGLIHDKVIREDDTLDSVARSANQFAEKFGILMAKNIVEAQQKGFPSISIQIQHRIKRSLIYINGARYTFTSLLLLLLRSDERRLRKLAKSLIQN